jgi:hypothetical protein
MSYPPTPSKKSCNCEDACISTDDVYYAGPNLPNSGINTYNILTSVIEKLDAIYAVPTLQRVTETGNVTTLPIIADSFVKIGGNGTNVLLDNGTTISLSSIGGSQNLQEVTDIGAITTNPITANAFIKSGGDGNNLLLDDGTVLPISDLPVGVTKTSELINDGQDGIHPFITAEDIPAFVPSDYNLDEFTNTGIDPFAHVSDIPAPLGYTPVNKAGDTMLGDLILNQDPSTALQAATKQYVDNIVSGINFHTPVTVATTGSLVATYNNGIDGVGATLTGPSVGVLMIDGETPTYLQRILVWQQADPIQNGIYDLTTVGDALNIYQLTRSADADNSPPGEIHYGDYTLVLSGDTNGGFGFICNTPGTIDIGTTPINYVQFNAAQAVTAGYGLKEITPNVIEIDSLVTQEKITLTTTGTTGSATFITNTLNIPTLPQATASVSGYLSSTDWNTFNNKANVNSQVFTGTPSLPTGTIGVTQVAGTNNTTLATTEFVATAANNRLVTETTSGYTLTNTDSGGIVIFKTTAAQTLTIPTGLADGFECTFVTLSGVTLTVVSTGNTLNNNTGTVMLPQLSFTLKRMLATNTYITAGSL